MNQYDNMFRAMYDAFIQWGISGMEREAMMLWRVEPSCGQPALLDDVDSLKRQLRARGSLPPTAPIEMALPLIWFRLPMRSRIITDGSITTGTPVSRDTWYPDETRD